MITKEEHDRTQITVLQSAETLLLLSFIVAVMLGVYLSFPPLVLYSFVIVAFVNFSYNSARAVIRVDSRHYTSLSGLSLFKTVLFRALSCFY